MKTKINSNILMISATVAIIVALVDFVLTANFSNFDPNTGNYDIYEGFNAIHMLWKAFGILAVVKLIFAKFIPYFVSNIIMIIIFRKK